MGSLIIPLSTMFVGAVIGFLVAAYFIDPYGSVMKFFWQSICYILVGGFLGTAFGLLIKGIIYLLSLL